MKMKIAQSELCVWVFGNIVLNFWKNAFSRISRNWHWFTSNFAQKWMQTPANIEIISCDMENICAIILDQIGFYVLAPYMPFTAFRILKKKYQFHRTNSIFSSSSRHTQLMYTYKMETKRMKTMLNYLWNYKMKTKSAKKKVNSPVMKK